MQKSREDRLAQVLLYVVLGFLLLFLGFGSYALIQLFVFQNGSLSLAGFLSLGMCLIGFGIVLLLQASLMTSPGASFWQTFRMLGGADVGIRADQLEFVTKVQVTSGGNDGTMYLCGDGLYYEAVKQGACLPLLYERMTGYSLDDMEICLHGDFLDDTGASVEEWRFLVKPLQKKVLTDELKKKGVTLQ